MLLGFDNERRWIRHAHHGPEVRVLFPTFPASRTTTSDSKSARGLLCKESRVLAEISPSWSLMTSRITDATRYGAGCPGIGVAAGPCRTRWLLCAFANHWGLPRRLC